jgi:UDP:flavonoid glycosyltransferase YjiC (YdhE family)
MRVYFAPSGLGLGHVGRCLPIAEELRRLGITSFFSGYGQGVAYLKRTGFLTKSVPPIGLAVRPDGTIDFKWTLISPGPRFIPILLKQLSHEIRLIETYRPDVVVADSRATPIAAARLLGIPNVLILNQYSIVVPRRRRFFNLAKIFDGFLLTVVGGLWGLADSIVVTDFPEPYTLSLVNLRIPSPYLNKLRLIGPVVSARPEDFEDRRQLRKKFGVKNSRKLVYAAISGPVGEKRYLVDRLLEILPRFPDRYVVFLSTGVPNGSTEQTRKGNLTVIPWLENRFELIKACDLLICRGGHGTLSQAMFFGKPTIVIPTPSHTEQFGNALRASAFGFAKILKQENLTFENLLEYVDSLSNSEEMLKRAEEISSNVSDIDAKNSLIEIILNAVRKGSSRNYSPQT